MPSSFLSYRDLLDRMADPELIADLSQPGSRLVSSSDPSGGNADYGHFVRPGPSGWRVLVEAQGPGYVSRFWCTGASTGQKRIRIYIDNDRDPALETTLDDWFGRAGFDEHQPMRGYEPYCWFSWLPISFNRSLTIMQEAPVGDEKIYYQVNLQRLPDEQTVESWSPGLMDDPAVQRRITDLKTAWRSMQTTGPAGMPAAATLAPGQETTVWQAPGAGIIERIRLAVRFDPALPVADREARLRALWVRLYWDGHATPSVDVPLGALGGSLWREQQYASAYFGMADGVYRIAFPMPYRRDARLAILNATDVPVPLAAAVSTAQRVPGETLGYFHAHWRKSAADEVGRPHVVASLDGRGKYVGCLLGVRSLDPSWWVLESDERIFLDDAAEPGWDGTGLEDYFNGGWYYANPIAAPFHGMVFKAPFRTLQYRLHPFDPVVFSNRFHMIFERGPANVSNAEMESVAYYYLREPRTADTARVDPSERRPVDDPLATVTLMTEVVNMERLGDVMAAINTIRDYLARNPQTPFRDVLERRIRHYHAPPVIPPGKAILGVYANAPAQVWINGMPRLSVSDNQGERVLFRNIDLPPGRHVIAVAFARRPYPDWIQVMLEWPGGFLGTDNTWVYAFDPASEQWSDPDFDDADWPRHNSHWVKGPPEAPYVWCEPNDRPWTQSRAWGLRAPIPWPPGTDRIVFRKRFVVECPDPPAVKSP